MGTRYVILGDGAAGITAAQGLRSDDPSCSIKIVSDDPHPAYYRAALTNYLLGELRDEQIWAVPPTFFADVGAERILGRVTMVDPGRAHVWLANGTPLPYDKLLIATGARARPAPFEGAQLAGVATLRTLQDTRWMMDLIKLHGLQRAVVVGGGPLSLEWALSLRARGVNVTILVRERGLMPGALDEVASDLLLARLRQGGIDLRVMEEVQAALPASDGSGNVGAVRTKSGDTLPCELVAVGIGVMCNTEFLEGSGIALGRRNGIAVDHHLRTSAQNVFAAGDVAEVDGSLIQLWEPARLQGRVAATNMAGGDRVYAPGVQYFATRLFDLDFAALGNVARDSLGPCTEYVDAPRGGGRIAYRKVVIRDGKLVSALMLGERESRVRQRGRLFKRLIDEGLDVTAIGAQLLDPEFDLAAWLRTSKSMLEKPQASFPAAGLLAGAQLRGTQQVNVRELAGAPHAKTRLETVTAPVASANPPYLESAARRFPLDGGVVSIGRDPRGTIALEDPGVSHVHAQITAHGAALFLRDLGSRNGTWVNGSQVTVPHLLRTGDRIIVGGSELTFRVGDAVPAPNASNAARTSAPSASRTSAALIGGAGSLVGHRFAIPTSPSTVGRDLAAQVRIEELSISRRHAVVTRIEGSWYFSDLHSSAGSTVNGVRATPGQDVRLRDGDTLTLGTVALIFREG